MSTSESIRAPSIVWFSLSLAGPNPVYASHVCTGLLPNPLPCSGNFLTHICTIYIHLFSMWFLPLALRDVPQVYCLFADLVQVMLSRKGQYHLPWKHLQKHRAMWEGSASSGPKHLVTGVLPNKRPVFCWGSHCWAFIARNTGEDR